MIISPITNEVIIKQILPHEPNLAHIFLGIVDKNNIIGLYELQEISKICINIHLFIKTEYRTKGLGLKSYLPLFQYLKKTSYKSSICTIPANNKEMIDGIQKTKWKCTGKITNGIIWENELTDLIIFEHNI